MINPHLNDLTSRICRDHVRKLGYEDRLFGTMRLALQYDVKPENLALGAAAAVISLSKTSEEQDVPIADLPDNPSALTAESLGKFLRNIWGDKTDAHAAPLIELTWQGLQKLL